MWCEGTLCIVFSESSLPLVPRLSPKIMLPRGSPFPLASLSPLGYLGPFMIRLNLHPHLKEFPEILTSLRALTALKRKSGSTIVFRSQPRDLGCPSLTPEAAALLEDSVVISKYSPLWQLTPDRSAGHFLSVGRGCLL